MPQFTFSALNEKRDMVNGEVTADDHAAAMKSLVDQGLLVTQLEQRKIHGTGFLGLRRSLKSEDLLAFTQEMASMINAAIPVPRALDIIAKDSRDPLLKSVVGDLARGFRGGTPLAELMAQHPRVFSKFYVSLVRSGESAGNLPQILTRLAAYIESSTALQGRLVGALAYPTVILVFAIVVIGFIFVYGIPQFREIYGAMGRDLPPLTLLFVSIGGFLSHNLLWLCLLLAGLAGYARWLLNLEATRTRIDAVLLHLWIVGPLVQRVALARFARTLATLLDAGMPIIRTLELVASATGNRILEKAVLKAAADVKEGGGLADSLRSCQIFTEMAISMVAAGEESGTLPPMLAKLADFYEVQVDQSLKALTGIIEPLIMMGVGAAVAVIILVLGLPLFNLASSLGG